MEKQCIAVPGISEMLAISGVPLSPAVKAGSLVFVSGMPPIDRDSGKIVEGGYQGADETGSGKRQGLFRGGWFIPGQGCEMQRICRECRPFWRHKRNLCAIFR